MRTESMVESRTLRATIFLAMALGIGASVSVDAEEPSTEADSADRVDVEPTETTEKGTATEEGLGVTSDAAPVVVKEGDTLWDLSAKHLGSPWNWPKLWSYNPHITNPHWIYPGDRIFLSPQAAEAIAEATPTEEEVPLPPSEEEGFAVEGGPLVHRQVGINLPKNAFVEEEEIRSSGKVIGAKEPKFLLTAHDDIYLSFETKNKRPVGQQYSVYRLAEHVRHPVTGSYLGWLVEVIGSAHVGKTTKQGVTTATLLEASAPVERGMRVGPIQRRYDPVPPRRNSKDLEGVIVTSLPPVKMISADMLVIVDQGREAGVNAGNRFFVVRAGDGTDQPPSEAPDFPREIMAEAIVVEPKKHTSLAFVLRTRRELRVSDRVQMQRGY